MCFLAVLRSWKARGRTVFVLIWLESVVLLFGGCGEVGSPSNGAHAVGRRLAITTRGVGAEPGSSPPTTQGFTSAGPVGQSSEPQILDLASVPIAPGLPTSTQDVRRSHTRPPASSSGSREASRGHRRARVLAESSTPKNSKNDGPVVVASPLHAAPDSLPDTEIVR